MGYYRLMAEAARKRNDRRTRPIPSEDSQRDWQRWPRPDPETQVDPPEADEQEARQ